MSENAFDAWEQIDEIYFLVLASEKKYFLINHRRGRFDSLLGQWA